MRVLGTHSIHQFPFHFPSHASPCAIRFQTHSIMETSVQRYFSTDNFYSTQVIMNHPRNTSQHHLLLAHIHFPHLPHSLITVFNAHSLTSHYHLLQQHFRNILEGQTLLQNLHNIQGIQNYCWGFNNLSYTIDLR